VLERLLPASPLAAGQVVKWAWLLVKGSLTAWGGKQ